MWMQLNSIGLLVQEGKHKEMLLYVWLSTERVSNESNVCNKYVY